QQTDRGALHHHRYQNDREGGGQDQIASWHSAIARVTTPRIPAQLITVDDLNQRDWRRPANFDSREVAARPAHLSRDHDGWVPEFVHDHRPAEPGSKVR